MLRKERNTEDISAEVHCSKSFSTSEEILYKCSRDQNFMPKTLRTPNSSTVQCTLQCCFRNEQTSTVAMHMQNDNGGKELPSSLWPLN